MQQDDLDIQIADSLRSRGIAPTPERISSVRARLQGEAAPSPKPPRRQLQRAVQPQRMAPEAALEAAPEPEPEQPSFIDRFQAGAAAELARGFQTLDVGSRNLSALFGGTTYDQVKPGVGGYGGMFADIQSYFEGVATNPENVPTLKPGEEEDFWTGQVASGLGSMVPYALASLTGAGVAGRIGAAIAPGVYGGATQGTDAYFRILDETGDEDKAWTGALMNIPVGASESLGAVVPAVRGLAPILTRMNKATGGALTRSLLPSLPGVMLKSGGKEAVQEFVQGASSEAIDRYLEVYPEDRRTIMEVLGEVANTQAKPAFGVGLILGPLAFKAEQAEARARGEAERSRRVERPELVERPTPEEPGGFFDRELKPMGARRIVETPEEFKPLEAQLKKRGLNLYSVETEEGSPIRGAERSGTGDLYININRPSEAIKATLDHEIDHKLETMDEAGYKAKSALIKKLEPELLREKIREVKQRYAESGKELNEADAEREGIAMLMEEDVFPLTEAWRTNPKAAEEFLNDERSSFKKIVEATMDVMNELGARFDTRRARLGKLLADVNAVEGRIKPENAARIAKDFVRTVDMAGRRFEKRQEFAARRAQAEASRAAAAQERQRVAAEVREAARAARPEGARFDEGLSMLERRYVQQELRSRMLAREVEKQSALRAESMSEQELADRETLSGFGDLEAQRKELASMLSPRPRKIPAPTEKNKKATRLETRDEVRARVEQARRLEPMFRENEAAAARAMEPTPAAPEAVAAPVAEPVARPEEPVAPPAVQEVVQPQQGVTNAPEVRTQQQGGVEERTGTGAVGPTAEASRGNRPAEGGQGAAATEVGPQQEEGSEPSPLKILANDSENEYAVFKSVGENDGLFKVGVRRLGSTSNFQSIGVGGARSVKLAIDKWAKKRWAEADRLNFRDEYTKTQFVSVQSEERRIQEEEKRKADEYNRQVLERETAKYMYMEHLEALKMPKGVKGSFQRDIGNKQKAPQEATLYGNLAISLEEDGSYVVSHVPTGLRVYDGKLNEAKRFVKAVFDSGIDMSADIRSRPDDMKSLKEIVFFLRRTSDAAPSYFVNRQRGEGGASGSAQFSLGRVTPEQDRAYLAAVNAGDMTTAQRMVDEAAKMAGYTKKAYHGSPEQGINEFTTQRTAVGFYFSPDENTAEFYTGGDGGRVYPVFLDMGRTIDLTDESEAALAISEVFSMGNKERDRDNVLKFAARLYKEGYGKSDAVTKFFDSQDGIADVLSGDYSIEELLSDNMISQSEVDSLVESIGSDKVSQQYEKQAPATDTDVDEVMRAYGTQDFYMNYQDDLMYWARANYDSVVFDDPSTTGASLSYVVFDNSRIKSAEPVTRDDQGNVIPLSQRFQPESPDIRFSLGEQRIRDAAESGVRFSLDIPRRLGDFVDGVTGAIPAYDSIRTSFVDYLTGTRELASAAAGKASEKIKAVQATLLRKGIVADRLAKTFTPKMNELAKAIKERGVALEDINEFMRARMSPLANKRAAEVNRSEPGIEKMDGEEYYGGAYTDAEAAEVMRKLQSQPNYSDLVEIVKMVDAINELKIDINVRSGRISADLAAAMRQQYNLDANGIANPHGFVTGYGSLKSVPETSVVEDEFISGTGIGRGIGKLGKPFQARTGTRAGVKRELVNPVVQALVDLNAAVIREVKAEEQRAWRDFVQEVGNKEFAVLLPSLPTVRTLGSDGYVHIVPDPAWAEREGVLPYLEDGKWKAIEFKGNNRLIAEDLKGLTVAPPIKFIAKATQKMTSMMTRQNPVFFLTNVPRDFGWAFMTGASRYGKGFTKQYVRSYMPSFRELFANQFLGREPSKDLADYIASGAPISTMGVADYNKTLGDLEKAVQSRNGNLLFDAWEKYVGGVNDVFENASRFAAFKVAREQGKSVGEAALVAKEGIALNFEQTGRRGRQMNSLYGFFSAGINGTDAAIRLLTDKDPTVRRRAGALVAMTVGLGVAQEVINRSISGEDEDGKLFYDGVSNFEKNRNAVFMTSSDSYTKIPLPFGFNALYAIGRNIGAYLMGAVSAEEAATDAVSFLMESASPFGAGPLAQVVSPTLLDPVIQMTMNQSFTGAKIAPDLETFGRELKAPHDLYWKNTPELPKWLAAEMAKATERGKTGRGYIDVRPDMLEHVFSAYTGGVGSFGINVIDNIGSVTKGEVPEARQIVAVRQLFGNASPYAIDKRYSDAREAIEQARSRFDELRKSGDLKMAAEWRKENAPLFRAYNALKNTERVLDRIDNTVENEDKRRTIKARFNKIYFSLSDKANA